MDAVYQGGGGSARQAPRLTAEVQRLGVLLSLAALLIVLIVAGRAVWTGAVTAPTAARLQRGVLAIQASHRTMLDADSAWSRYLATGDQVFADSATATAPRLATANAQMIDQLEEPQLRQDALSLLLAQQRWQSDWADQARQLPPPGGQDAFLRQGKVIFDDYQARADVALRDTLQTIGDGQQSALASQRITQILIVMIGLAALTVALRGRARLRRHVVVPVDGLLTAVQEISEGRLRPPAPVTGSAELVALRDGLADMTVALGRQRDGAAAQAERLQAQTHRLRAILIMTREIAGSLNVRHVIDSTVRAAVAITGGRVLLWLLDEDGNGLELAFDSDRGAVPPMEAHCTLGVGLVGRSARYGQVSRGDVDTGEDDAAAVPLVVGARVIGVLECWDALDDETGQVGGPGHGGIGEARGIGEAGGIGGARGIGEAGGIVRVGEQKLSAVEMLATLSGSAIDASRSHAATERLAQLDPLTQLANRRRLEVDLDNAVADSKRHGHAMSVVMLDLDHFKELNDRYGNPRGDLLLQEVASTLRAEMRDGETAYRYGGEEFAVLVPRDGAAVAATLAERLRARIATDFRRGDKQLITASFGVAAIPDHAGDSKAVVAEADRALHSAKDAGRNRVHNAGQVID